MFTEDLSVFFSDFGVLVTWTTTFDTYSTRAIYSAPGSDKDIGGGIMVSTNDHEIMYETAALPGLEQGAEIIVTIDGVDTSFRVRGTTPIDDGKLCRATLKKTNG
jgi:hypothetical protein